MKIAETYSHLNGLEFLIVHKPTLWKEIQAVIAAVDATKCKTKVSKEKTMKGELLFSPIDMNATFKRLLRAKKWEESRVSYWVTRSEKLIRKTLTMSATEQKKEIEAAGEKPIFSYNQTDFVKDRVAVEVQFGKYAFVAYDLFVKHLAFYVGDHIDVGIEILPMKSLQSHMSSGVAYYEGEFYNVVRQGRGVPAVPLVIVGIQA
ncbi:MAG: restriction endonuclease [Chloroflexi bacterium]|nr:restriction endonuclease [Chloroflexota bacterium]